MSSPLAVIVLGLSYPQPGAAESLDRAVGSLDPGPVRHAMERFVGEVTALELGEWEELHTRTLDLSPLFVPYVGHVVWGESYRRGAFMSELQREQIDLGADQHGELPDHVIAILEYLELADHPHSDLMEVLPQAVATMQKELRKAEADNPYRHVLAALAAVIDSYVTEGVRA